MEEQPTYRQRWNRAFDLRPANRRTAGFWQILPPPDFDLRRRNDVAALGPYETRYDVNHGYSVERTIVDPAANAEAP